MSHNIWQGQLVRLRGVEPEDWKHFFEWNSDTELARYCYAIPMPDGREAVRKWATETATAGIKDGAYRWVIETLDGQFVGTLNTHTCDPRHGTFSYGLAILRQHWRKGYASEAILLVLRHYFYELRYQKVTVHIYEFNKPSLHLHERLAFHQEGRLRSMVYTDGCYYDEFVYGMTVEEFAHNYGSER